jgi:hypothetical protein
VTLVFTFLLFFGVVVIIALFAALTGRFLTGSCGGVAGDCVCKAEGRFPGSCDYDGGPKLPVAENPSET